MGDCLCKSSANLGKSYINYPMNDLTSVFKDENMRSKQIKNEKFKETKRNNACGVSCYNCCYHYHCSDCYPHY